MRLAAHCVLVRAPSHPSDKVTRQQEKPDLEVSRGAADRGQEDRLMARPKKYEALVVAEPAEFTAQVVRRCASIGTRIERMASGFAMEAEACQWASDQLGQYPAGRKQARTRREEHRRRGRERKQAVLTLSLRELAEINPLSSTPKDRIGLLWQEVVFRAWKAEDNGRKADAIANVSVGRRWSQRLSNALSGRLDEIPGWTRTQALANARWLASAAAEQK